MMEFFLASQNVAFTVALAVMLVIAVLEGITTLFGSGLSGLFESLLPETDVDIDVGAGADGAGFDATSGLSRVLGWLHIGQVPILMLLVVFLTAFGLIGLGVQYLAWQALGSFLPGLPASGISCVASLPMVRLCGGILARIMPRDETEAVSEESFIGRIATITLGKATLGRPAQARLMDEYRQTHYVLVEPDDPNEVFETGTSVVLVSRQGTMFKGIRIPNAALVDE